MGSTLDISRTGVRFRTAEPLPVGVQVAVTISWPSRIDEREVSVWMAGVIVRSRGNEVAAQIVQSSFKRGRLLITAET